LLCLGVNGISPFELSLSVSEEKFEVNAILLIAEGKKVELEATRIYIDCRVAVSANIEFLYNESFGVNNYFYNEPIRDERAPWRLSAIKEPQVLIEKTITTLHVYKCFKCIYFGKQLEMKSPIEKVAIRQQGRRASLRFIPGARRHSSPLTTIA
jgi:hypothetical protein